MLYELKELSKSKSIFRFNFAIIYAGLGENDMAFEWLNKSYQKREVHILSNSEFLDILSDDPRWDELNSRIRKNWLKQKE
jgi:hypothetical protein